MIKRFVGVLLILFGTALALWIGYNLFIALQPAAKGRSPLPALGFTALLFYIGVKWVRGD